MPVTNETIRLFVAGAAPDRARHGSKELPEMVHRKVI